MGTEVEAHGLGLGLDIDSRGAPANIDRLHVSDELVYFSSNGQSAYAPAPTLPTTVASKTFAIPAYDGIKVQRV